MELSFLLFTIALMKPAITRIGEFTPCKISRYEYEIGELGMDVPLDLSEEQKTKMKEFVISYFGEDAYIIGEVKFAILTVQIGSKKRKEEYGLKLLSEGREAEAKYYLKDEQ